MGQNAERRRPFAGIVEQFSQTSHPKPFDKAVQALFNLRFRVVAEQVARFRDVGKRLRYVPWLWRLAIDGGVRIKLLFEQ